MLDYEINKILKPSLEKIAFILSKLNQDELLKDMKELDPDRREIYQNALEIKLEKIVDKINLFNHKI